MTGHKPVTAKVAGEMLAEAISNSEFREKLLTDPDEALNSKGFTADQSAIDFFKVLAKSGFEKAVKKIEKTSPLATGEASGNSGGGQSPQGNGN
jgi:hypothetical protein